MTYEKIIKFLSFDKLKYQIKLQTNIIVTVISNTNAHKP